MGTLHGRWKLVYTSNTTTLMLLNAIQSFPLVSEMGLRCYSMDPYPVNVYILITRTPYPPHSCVCV